MSKRAIEEFKRRFRHIPEIIMNQGDVDIADVEIAEDYVEHIPMPPGFSTNRKGFKDFVIMLRTAFPDLHYDIDHLTTNDLIGENQKVVHRITAHATHTGPWGPIPPTNKKMTWTEIHIGLYVQGMLVEHWGSIDSLGIMQQMGAIPGWFEKPPTPPTPDLSGLPDTSVEENIAMTRRFIKEVWNKGNFAVANEMIAEHGVAPSQTIFPPGPEGARLGAQMWHNAFANFYMLIEDTIAEENVVALRFKVIGKHQAPFRSGIPATGRLIEMDGCSIFHFDGGKIVERWMEVDRLGLVSQLTAPE